MRVYLSSADAITPSCMEIMKDVKNRAIPGVTLEFVQIAPGDAIPDKAVVFAMGAYKRQGNERVVPAPSVAQTVTKPDIVTRLSTAFRLLTSPPELPEFEYTVIDDLAEAIDFLASLSDYPKIVVDIETSGDIDVDRAEPRRIISIAITAGGMAYVFTEELCGDTLFYREFCAFMERNGVIAVNGKFDLKYFPDSKVRFVRDTQLAHYALFPAAGAHDLKSTAKMFFGFEDWDAPAKKYTGKASYDTYEKFEDGSWHDAREYSAGSGYERIPRDMLYRYNAFDVYATWHWDVLMEEFLADDPESQMVLEWLMKYSEMFMPIELRGIRLDLPYLEELSKELTIELADEKAKLNEISDLEAGVNPSSPVQINKWFSSRGVELPKRRNSKKQMAPSTSEDAITEFIESEAEETPEVQFAQQLLVCRGLVKTLGTYVDGYRNQADEHGIVRPGYKLTASITGRLGGQGASMLTIPREKRLKKMVLPYEPGHVVIGADASQMELRIMALESMDEWLIEAFQPDAPDFFDNLLTQAYPKVDWFDLHARVENHTATEAEANYYNKKRADIKGVVYGVSFNRQAPAISKALKITMHEAFTLMDAFVRPGSAFALWREDITERAVNGEAIVTRFGRHFQSELVTKANKQSVINSAMAFTSQSTGNDLLLSAALEVVKNLPAYGAHMMGTIHDAVYASGPKKEAELIGEMIAREIQKSGERVYGTLVPFKSSWGFGANLAEA